MGGISQPDMFDFTGQGIIHVCDERHSLAYGFGDDFIERDFPENRYGALLTPFPLTKVFCSL
jgi:hypothetical protein